MANKYHELRLEDRLTSAIDKWLEELDYEADGGYYEAESIKRILSKLIFAYTGERG